jgi:hypothetical protein
MVDDMCFIRSMHTEAINHEPAITLMQTGNQVTGRPCLGAWASYGLGSLNHNLPTFVVLVAKPSNTEQVQAISARLWSSGYLSGEHAGVSFRSGGDPILYINNPPGVPAAVRRKTLDGLKALNEMSYHATGDPETHTRIGQYEMAFRMQASVPELTDLGREPASTFGLYGDEARKPGTFANSVLLARRLVERGVRFVQIYHNNWDTHANVAGRLPDQCRDVDRPCDGLIQDLKRREMFDSTHGCDGALASRAGPLLHQPLALRLHPPFDARPRGKSQRQKHDEGDPHRQTEHRALDHVGDQQKKAGPLQHRRTQDHAHLIHAEPHARQHRVSGGRLGVGQLGGVIHLGQPPTLVDHEARRDDEGAGQHQDRPGDGQVGDDRSRRRGRHVPSLTHHQGNAAEDHRPEHEREDEDAHDQEAAVDYSIVIGRGHDWPRR